MATQIISWSWDETPTVADFTAALAALGVHVTEPDTGLAEHVMVLSDQPMTTQEATEAFYADADGTPS
jgi:hypothetical protein